MKNIILILSLISILFADDVVRVGITKLTMDQGMPVESNASIGFSNMITATISDISSANPASLSNFSSIAAGVYFENSSKIDYLYNITIDKANELYPASIGIVYPYNDFVFGLAYFRKYSNFMDYGQVPILTVQNPGGTDEFFKMSTKTIIHSPSAIVAKVFNNILNPGDQLSLGVQLFWDFWTEEEKIGSYKGTINVNNPSWKVGMVYNIVQNLGFGVCFEKGVDLDGTTDSDLQSAYDLGGFHSTYFSGVSIVETFQLPDKLSFGFSGQTMGNLIFSTTATIVYWKSIQSQFQDQLDLSASIVYSFSEMFDFSLGVYKTDKNLSDRHSYFGYDHNATFIDIGVRVKIKNINVFAEYLDSQNFSSKYRKQTILKFGLEYQFD